MIRVSAMFRDERGFTLAELLVVTAVLGLILAGVVLVQQRGQEAYLFGSHRVEVQQNNRSALELMVRELRSAQSVTAIPSATMRQCSPMWTPSLEPVSFAPARDPNPLESA